MRADIKAFAKAAETFLIFALQLPSNIVSLFKHFGKQRFQNCRSKPRKRKMQAVRRQIRMTKTLTILILSFSLSFFSQDKVTISKDSLSQFYNKTIINTLTNPLRKQQCEKYGVIIIQTDFDTTALIKKAGDIKFRYYDSKTSIQSVLEKLPKKYLKDTIYSINHHIAKRDTVAINIDWWTIDIIDKKMWLLACKYGETASFIYDHTLNKWIFIPGSVFINRRLDEMEKGFNKN